MKHTPEQARQLWIEALRSGEYVQTKSVLCRLNGDGEPKGYCCLGVACEVYRREGGLLEITKPDPDEDGDLEDDCVSYNGACSYLPNSVTKWLGLTTDDGRFGDPDCDMIDSLTDLNDGQDYTFEQIAVVIESNLPGMFTTTDHPLPPTD